MDTQTDSDSTDSPLRVSTFLDKGGVGKTTAAAHIAVAAAEHGRSPVIIDLAGKQNDLAKHFGLYEQVLEADPWPHIGQVFGPDWPELVDRLGRDEALAEMVWETDEGVDIVPSSKSLDGVDNDLSNLPVEERYSRLDAFLTDYFEPAFDYDFIVIDMPGLTNNVVINGLWAAENIVAPVEPGEFEEKQMDALIDDINAFTETFEIDLRLAMVLPNEVNAETTVGGKVMESLTERFEETLAPEPIPRSQDIRNVQKAGQTLFALEDRLATGERACNAYKANTAELLSRLDTPITA